HSDRVEDRVSPILEVAWNAPDHEDDGVCRTDRRPTTTNPPDHEPGRSLMTLTTPTRPRARPSRPPGPKGHWVRGHLAEFRTGRLDFLTHCARTYGDVVALRLGPKRIWALNHPDLVEEVLVTKNRAFIKHFGLRTAKPTLGEGLVTSEGDFWRR